MTAPNQVSAADEVSLDPSQVLKVRLPLQRGAADAWRLASGAAADSVLRLERQETERPQVGRYWNSPLHEIFTFRSTGTGTTTLTFAFDRQWEPGAGSSRMFTLTVTVE